MLGLAAALAAGLVLRLYRLREQILTGDELHAVHGALSRTVGEILRNWTYHGADYSVPLTAWFRLLMDHGVVLTEMGFRAPSLVAGGLTLIVVPLALWRRLGPAAAVVLAWLLAISPMLVLYGRMARSYALVVLLAAGAALAFERWWSLRSRAAGAAFVVLGALCVHLHLGSAPFVLSPFLFAALALVATWREQRPRLPGLVALLGALLALVAALLLPARASLLELVGLHGGGSVPAASAWLEVGRLQVGTASGPLALVAALALVRGAFVLARRDRGFALYLLVLAVGHVLGLALLAPNFLHAAIVANRYLLLLLPFALALVALGLATPLAPRLGRTAAWAQAVGVAAVLAALFWSGPLAGAEYRWSSFTHAQPFVLLTRPADRMPPSRVPRFYRELPPGDEPVLEAPWTNVGTHSFAAYQALHRRPLRVASADRMLDDPRLALRNTVPATAQGILGSGARWAVVHLDLRREEQFVETFELRHAERLQRLPELWVALRGAGARIATELEATLGPPTYEDEVLRVWDLHAPAEAWDR